MFHKAKKSLGQNFLRSKGAIRSIVEAGEIKEGDIVIEIGPGKGVLTEALLQAGAEVIAIEKDDDLFVLLSDKFKELIASKKLCLVHADVLDLKVEDILEKNTLEPKGYKLVANIPYNITGEVFRKFLEKEKQPSLLVLLVQKEVAERIMVRDGKESILSISIKAYGIPKYIGTVKREMFSPAPNVDSAILKIYDISKKTFETSRMDEGKFFIALKKGFAHKRKMLPNNIPEIKTIASLSAYKEKRAEELSVPDWINIAKEI